MKGRKQKTQLRASSLEINAVRGNKVKGFTFIEMSETNIVTPPTENGLMEKIISHDNVNRACMKVVRNKGCHGIDGLKVDSLYEYLSLHGDEILDSIKVGTYKPNPVRRVEIPKDNNTKRPLGIPTVMDRVIQQAIQQVLSPIYEQHFSESSFGFRPKRSTHGALEECRSILSEGYRYAVDIDMEKFFDTVNHSKLIEVISREVKDGRVVSLIHKYLKAGVVVNHDYEPTIQGVPQGGPLSPLLSNIMLNELDNELEKRGHRFVRYADDMVIFCKSRRAGDRIKQSVSNFVRDKLFLRVNEEKTKVVYFNQIKFLGYSFYKNKGIRFRIHPSKIKKLKDDIRLLTSRSNGWGDAKRKKKTREFIRGWVNYFKYADILRLLTKIDAWYRRRLRMVIWKQWKRISTKFRNLKKLGIKEGKAWEYANTRKSYWRVSASPILQKSVTDKRLEKAGYLFFSNYYKQVRMV